MHAMISPYSHSPGADDLPRSEPLSPPKINEPAHAIVPTLVPYPGEPAKEKGPGSAFGPESGPLATGSASVVYWVPGPFPRPTPYPAGSAPQASSALPTPRRPRGRLDADAPRRGIAPNLDEPVGPASEPGAGLSSNIPLIPALSTANPGLRTT